MRQTIAKLGLVGALATVVTMGSAVTAEAVPFTITSQLTGDFRSNTPDNLIVDVTVTGDTTSNVTHWTVDINSPLHTNARLGVFAFSLDTLYTDVSFSNFSPSSWSISPGTNVPGSGSADFTFESNDPPGQANNVTNSVNLTFDATLLTGNWTTALFTGADLATGDGIPAPGAQLGAHLQSLSTAGCSGCSSSGFASGNYSTPDDPPPPAPVPEPTTLALMGAGLAAAAVRRARRRA
jgi:hypothetical protein